jgi:IclR family transcriptional regulator, acetate operon repressor
VVLSQQRYGRGVPAASDTSTVARVATVLHTLATEGPELPVSEIARHVGRERSQISRMLKALAAAGLVEQDPETRTYRLGWQLFVLADNAGDQRLTRAAQPVLRALVAETRETALLSVLQGNRSLTILRERSPQSLQAGGWVGRTTPLHITASGRALLLDSAADEVRELIGEDLDAVGYGPNALSALPDVLRRLDHERRAGHTTADEELEAGLVSIGAPVRNPAGHIIASLNISGPSNRMLHRLDAYSTLVKVAARRLGTSQPPATRA